MVTSKSRINAYVDHDSYNAFEKWCDGHGCSASKGVELLIKEYLLGVTQNQVTGNVPNNLVTQESFEAAIAELRNEFNDKMGDFRSEMGDTAVTFPLMNRAIETAIDNRLKSFQFESVSCSELQTMEVTTQPIESIDTATDNTAIAVETIPDKEISVESEILPSQDAQINQETSNQDDSPITDTESLQSRFDAGEWIFAKDYADLLKTTPNALDKRRKNESLPKDIETKKEGRFREYRKLKTAIAG